MIRLGQKLVSDMYLGESKIFKAYLGQTLLYSKPPLIASYKRYDKTNEDSDGIEVKGGERYLSDNTLWECIKAHTMQEDLKLGISTASLWKEVNVEHSGTQGDPIPYNNNMELVKDKYYIQHDIVYLCTRSTEQPVYNDLRDLVGIYVKAMNLI